MARDRDRFRRRSKSREQSYGSRKPKYYFLVVTNGKSTEYNYFADYSESLLKGTVRIESVFENGSPTTVVKRAITETRKGKVDEVWAVCDKDDFPDFDSAVARCEKSDAKAGYSNPSFELWLLLHFQNVTAGHHRDDCVKKLEAHLQKASPGFSYDKSQDQKIHAMLSEHGDEKEACERAVHFENEALPQPWKTNPCTAIHKLVAAIQDKLETLEGDGETQSSS